jgi:glycosyltransferase involved in cell wall biosynthesis
MKIRVTFLIRRLDRGGAERQLIDLARGLNKQRFDVSILTFYSGGHFEREITPDSGIALVCLNRTGRDDLVGFLGRLVRTVRTLKPHIVHGYMSGANELSLVGRACGARVVWGLRSTELKDVQEELADRLVFRAGALLSRLPDCIIANSQSARSFHAARGYSGSRLVVIPNGIDTDRFAILPTERASRRREWRVADHEILVGRAGRYHPMKDYPTFLKAAAVVSRTHGHIRFVCVGDGTDCAELREMAAREGIAERVTWTGGRSDMPAVYNAFDVSVSSSASGEGFPNAVAESMACGTPCVATNVGDSASVVDGLGVVVGAADPVSLANGISRLIAAAHQFPRELVRQRITDNFSASLLVSRTEAAFERLVSAVGRGYGRSVACQPQNATPTGAGRHHGGYRGSHDR